MNAKSTAIWIVVAVAVLGGIYGLTYLAQTSPTAQSGSGNLGPIPPVTASDWVLGDPQASTTLIEYGDFECPVCSEYAPLISQIMQQFGGEVRFVYRFFPLESIHPNAAVSAAAAQAAGEQGKFWEMHDLLFKNQNDWAALGQTDAENIFQGYARTLGL
ncbi:DsbA family protein, partial [Patescibacteria group bacterium]|nr:DsbA family protein [Patescibacteria group bacterium]